jgi:hypothetical protein
MAGDVITVAQTGCILTLATRLLQATPEPMRSKGRSMSESEKALREQMTDAMEKIRQQVEILRSGPTMGGPSDDRSLIADLEAEFRALEEARAKLSSEEH